MEFLLQVTQFRLMPRRDPLHQLAALLEEMHFHASSILPTGATLDQPGLLATPDQCHGAVMLGLQPLGQLTHGGPLTPFP